MLLSMAFSTPEKVLQDGARAVAIAMMDLVATTLAQDVTSCVETYLQRIVESLTIITEELQKSAESATQTITQMQKNSQNPPEVNPNTMLYANALKVNILISHQTILA